MNDGYEYEYKGHKITIRHCQDKNWRAYWEYTVIGQKSFQGRSMGLLREVKAHLKWIIDEKKQGQS